MANKPKPLKAIDPPPPRPSGIPDRLWLLPLALQQFSKERGFFQKDAAKAADVDQSQISRWLQYRQLGGIPAATIVNLEDGLGLEPGSLLPRGITLSDPGVSRLAATLGIDAKLLQALKAKEFGAAMESYPHEARKAIMGVVHVYDATVEKASAVVHTLMQHKNTKGWSAATWFSEMRDELLKTGGTGDSGTRYVLEKLPPPKTKR